MPTENLAPAPYCVVCGQADERCGGHPVTASGTPRFCPTCGRRLSVVVVMPGQSEARCRDHGPPP